jgi:hypothetical protein
MTPLDRSDYSEIYWCTFGKSAGREACRQGWKRWQAIWRSGTDILIMHPTGTTVPIAHESDHFIVARHGPLRFVARASREHFLTLPDMWLGFTTDPPSQKLLASLGDNPRARARAFVHNSLVDGLIMHPVIGPAMAGAIAWLITSAETIGEFAKDYRLIGYDISFIPGPPGQRKMFNFRLVMHPDADFETWRDVVDTLPLPGWRPPPH